MSSYTIDWTIYGHVTIEADDRDAAVFSAASELKNGMRFVGDLGDVIVDGMEVEAQ